MLKTEAGVAMYHLCSQQHHSTYAASALYCFCIYICIQKKKKTVTCF